MLPLSSVILLFFCLFGNVFTSPFELLDRCITEFFPDQMESWNQKSPNKQTNRARCSSKKTQTLRKKKNIELRTLALTRSTKNTFGFYSKCFGAATADELKEWLKGSDDWRPGVSNQAPQLLEGGGPRAIGRTSRTAIHRQVTTR